MKVGVIILARLSSKRLPRKALIKLKGCELIKHIYSSVSQVVPSENIIVATSSDHTDDEFEDYLISENINYYRGSLNNVAKRFFDASQAAKFDYSVRINGDNIFLDTKLLSKAINLATSNDFDFISNVKDRTYPKGMSVEIVKTDYYMKFLEQILKSEYHSEHVMSLFYNLEEINRLDIKNERIPYAAGIQLALDTVDDLRRTELMLSKMNAPIWTYGLEEVYKIYESLQNE